MMLTVRDLVTAYGLGAVLHGVSVDVAAGEVVCLLGRNGAGKSTTLRSIMGLTPPRAALAENRHDEIERFLFFFLTGERILEAALRRHGLMRERAAVLRCSEAGAADPAIRAPRAPPPAVAVLLSMGWYCNTYQNVIRSRSWKESRSNYPPLWAVRSPPKRGGGT